MAKSKGGSSSLRVGLVADQPTPSLIHHKAPERSDVATDSKGLGWFFGVFVPTFQSIVGAILFLRLGWIVGQQGVIITIFGTFMLAITVVVLTAMSVAALATNGVMASGGVYFLLSRSLGPEFGGSIGLVYFMSLVAGTTFYVIGFVEVLADLLPSDMFGSEAQTTFILGTIILASTAFIALLGASAFARASLVMLSLMMCSILFAIVSVGFRDSGKTNSETPWTITGPSWETFQDNFSPNDQYTPGQSFLTVFAIFFPAVTGVLAGVNMSGDLSDPSEAIPQGTLKAMMAAFSIYLLFVFLMAASIPQDILRSDKLIMQNMCWYPSLVYSGIFLSVFGSAVTAVVGGARLLQRIAEDNIVPFLVPFTKTVGETRNPVRATLLLWGMSQSLLLLGDIEAITPLLTNFYLLTYATVNLACFALDISGAPNFRPTFGMYSKWTALAGFLLAFGVMFVLSPLYAVGSMAVFVFIFVLVHYTAPRVEWGDVSQALIFHQVRKYILKLDESKEHVKNWRPSLLVLSESPGEDINLLHFANQLKKGGLYIIGHHITGDSATDMVDKQGMHLPYANVRKEWISFSNREELKSFVEISVTPSFRTSMQSLQMHCGLGAMRPNCVLLGLPGGNQAPRQRKTSMSVFRTQFPRDTEKIAPSEWMSAAQDVIAFRNSLLVFANFALLDQATLRQHSKARKQGKGHIDIWVMDQLISKTGSWNQTTALQLELAEILHSQKLWKRLADLRVRTLVRTADDAGKAKADLEGLLERMRINAIIDVVVLEKEATQEDVEAPATRPAEELSEANEIALKELETGWEAANLPELLKRVGPTVKLASDSSLVLFVPLWPLDSFGADADMCVQKLREMVEGWAPTVMVHGAHDVVAEKQ